MPEQHKEDPTKKIAAGGGENAAGGIKSAEILAAAMKSSEERKNALGALDSINDQLRDRNSGAATDWKKLRAKWGPAVVIALQDRPGSVTAEREDMVDPMALLAARAFQRTDPEMKRLNDENGKQDPAQKKLIDESIRGNEAARKAFAALADRYPKLFVPLNLERGKLDALIGVVGGKMKGSEPYKSFGDRLEKLSCDKDLSGRRQLIEVDALLEEMADNMGNAAIENAAGYDGSDRSKRSQEQHRRQAAEMLPQLKHLMDLRTAMSKRYLGSLKSPDEVLEIESAQATAEKIASVGKVEASPVAAPAIRQAPERTAAKDGGRVEGSEREQAERQLLGDLLRDGASQMMTSLDSKVPGALSSGGFQTRRDSRFGTEAGAGRPAFDNSSGKRAGEIETSQMLGRLGINEVIGLRRVTEDTYENRQVEVAKPGLMGMLGRKETRSERVKTGMRTVMHGDRVAGGKQEPLVELSYVTVDGHENAVHLDYSGRTGQVFAATVRLPESLARRVLEHIKSNPAFVRKMIEQVATKQQGIPESAWKLGELNAGIPVKPPYEAWKAINGGKANVYVRSDLDGPGDLKVHQENIFRVE